LLTDNCVEAMRATSAIAALALNSMIVPPLFGDIPKGAAEEKVGPDYEDDCDRAHIPLALAAAAVQAGWCWLNAEKLKT